MAYGPLGLTDISTIQVKKLSIVCDERQDTGPDNFGLAVLDNIDVNGQLVGQGPGPRNPEGDSGDHNGGNG